MSRIKRTVLAGALGLGLLTSSCLGPFQTTNKLADWNRDFNDNKFVNELVFLGLNIVPAYGLAIFADVIVFNSIEFWGGDVDVD